MTFEMTVNPNETQISTIVFDRVLNAIGQSPKRTLLQYLERSYGISLSEPNIPSTNLETALSGLIGSGSHIILQMVENEISGRSSP